MSDLVFQTNKALEAAEAALSAEALDKAEADAIGGAGHLTSRLVSACMCVMPEGPEGVDAHRQLIYAIQEARRRVKNRIVDIRRKKNWPRGTHLAIPADA